MRCELSRASERLLVGGWASLTEAQSRRAQTQRADPERTRWCLLLRNLRFDVDERAVRKFVGRCAKALSVAMSTHKKSGRHIGKCYVAFESVRDAHCAMAELNGNLLRGRPVLIEFANIDELEDAKREQHSNTEEHKEKRKPIRFSRKIKLIGAQHASQVLID